MSRIAVESIIMNNGRHVPLIALGTYLGTESARDSEREINAVLHALKIGYRHIDTAAIYNSEHEVGEAIKRSGIPRSEVFVCTKLWNDQHDFVDKAVKQSLEKLQTNYIDLYLMHWPMSSSPSKSTPVQTWKAMEGLLKNGTVRSIGVSNFSTRLLQEILDNCTVKPACNQVEIHPFLPQHKLVNFCQRAGIVVSAWAPTAMQDKKVFDNTVVTELAEKYKISKQQLILSWLVNKKIIVLPKSTNNGRIEENYSLIMLDVKDIERMDDVHQDYKSDKKFFRMRSGKGDTVMGWTVEQLGWDEDN